MAKGTILGDTFEKLAELGASTAQKTVKSVSQIMNPFSNESYKTNSPEIDGKKNHTPVDFRSLENKYKNNDEQQADLLAKSLKNRYFQMVQNEGERSVEKEKMERNQKKRQEEYNTEEKKRRDQQRKNQGQQDDMPTGKGKRGVARRRKSSSEQQHAENKPASGKQ
jgi:hypothetical protein